LRSNRNHDRDGSCPVTGLHDIVALDDCHVFSLLLWLFPCPVALLPSWISLVMLLNSACRHDKIVMREFFIAVFGFWTKALWGRLFFFWLRLLLTFYCWLITVLSDNPSLIRWTCVAKQNQLWVALKKSGECFFPAVPCQAKHCFSLHKNHWSLTRAVDCVWSWGIWSHWGLLLGCYQCFKYV
jgi:hypothetical protein